MSLEISGAQPVCLGVARAGRQGGNMRTQETAAAWCNRNKSEEPAHEGLTWEIGKQGHESLREYGEEARGRFT